MASKIRVGEVEVFGNLKAVYVNDTPVGNGSDNKQIGDVQLVQLFLRHVFKLEPELFKKLPKPGGRNVGSILVDGKVGSQTIAAISEFQKLIIRRGKSGVFVDGRVSVQKGFRVAGTNHVFTIFQLNSFYFDTDPVNMAFNENLEDHPDLQNLPILAGELRRLGPQS